MKQAVRMRPHAFVRLCTGSKRCKLAIKWVALDYQSLLLSLSEAFWSFFGFSELFGPFSDKSEPESVAGSRNSATISRNSATISENIPFGPFLSETSSFSDLL